MEIQIISNIITDNDVRKTDPFPHVLKPGTPTNKVSFVFELGLELMVSG